MTTRTQYPINPADPVLDGCTTCGQIHLTITKAVGCAGHIPCRRRPTGTGRHCAAHAATAPDQLGPVVAYPVTNPLERLSMLAGRVEAWLNVAEKRLEAATSFGDSEGRLNSEVKAFNAIVTRLGYLLGLMARLDLDERLIRLDRVQADQLRELLVAVMRDPELGLSEVQQVEWPRAFARAARARVGPASSVPGVLTVDGEVT